MNEFFEYQDSLDRYADKSERTEPQTPLTPEQQERPLNPTVFSFLYHATVMEQKVDFENTDNTTTPVSEPKPDQPDAESLIKASRDEERDYVQEMFTEASDWIGEKLGMGYR